MWKPRLKRLGLLRKLTRSPFSLHEAGSCCYGSLTSGNVKVGLNDVLRRSERVVAQDAQGEHVLLALDTGRYYTLNEVGSAAWAQCDGATTLASVVEAVCAVFDAPTAVVEADLIELVGELLDEGLLLRGP